MDLPGTVKNLNKMDNNDRITRSMLSVIRESVGGKQLLNEGASSLPITTNTPQFADVREAQEEAIIKTIGENVEFDDKSLVFYAKNKDLVFTGKIPPLNITFQFRYNDPSGDGCYIWANALQLTETNNRTVGKIRDAFVNWKNTLVQDGDLFKRLSQAVNEQ